MELKKMWIGPLTMPFSFNAVVIKENSRWSQFWNGKIYDMMPVEAFWPVQKGSHYEEFQKIFDELGISKVDFLTWLDIKITPDKEVKADLGKTFTAAIEILGMLSLEPEDQAPCYTTTFEDFVIVSSICRREGGVGYKMMHRSIKKKKTNKDRSYLKIITHATCEENGKMDISELLTSGVERHRLFAKQYVDTHSS